MDIDNDLDGQLLQQFSSLGTTDKEVLIAEFQKLLGNQLNPAGCAFFLDMNNWNLQAAICSYYDFDQPSLKLPELAFISDVTVGEGEAVPPNTTFTKTWRIDEVLKDRDKVSVMEDHVEQLLVAMCMQFKMAYTTHMGDQDTPKDNVIRLYRCLLGTLLSLFQNAMLAVHASKDILKDLINNLVTLLLDNRLEELEDGPQVVRSVNVLVIKIVEKSDQTNALCALIRLLHECVDSQTCSSKFQELIMKCLWRMVRMLPERIKELNLDRILYDIHIFLRTFPSLTCKERGYELQLRTIKTIVHSMTKLKGSKILSHLGQIDAGETSEVKAYIQKVLKSEGNLHVQAEVNGNADENKTPRSASKTKRLSKTTHDMLTEIFKKVGSKENTREGLRDLYDFKKKYPEADIDPFLKKSSNFFQNYIERGLKAIENEEREQNEGKAEVPGSTEDGGIKGDYYLEKTVKIKESLSHEPSLKTSVQAGTAVDADYYMERLRKLRTQCGLEPETTNPAEKPSILTPKAVVPDPEPKESRETSEKNDSDGESDSNKQTTQQAPNKMADVSQLKARLEKIKKMANS